MTHYPTSRGKTEHPYIAKQEKRKKLLDEIRKKRAEVLKGMYKR